jgi:hypothetical protein
LVLLEDRRGGNDLSAGTPVRRFRLARLRLEGVPVPTDCRYEYLKRTHE